MLFLRFQSTSSTACASSPAPANWANQRRCDLPVAPNSTCGKSMADSRPRRITAHARRKSSGMPISRAKTLMVPSGSTPSRARAKPSGSSPIPLSTSFSVPSPPAATIPSKPSRTASAASARPPPGAVVGLSAHSAPMASRWRRNRFALSPLAVGLKMTQMRMADICRESRGLARRRWLRFSRPRRDCRGSLTRSVSDFQNGTDRDQQNRHRHKIDPRRNAERMKRLRQRRSFPRHAPDQNREHTQQGQ